jgi:Uma2 family endonuclease
MNRVNKVPEWEYLHTAYEPDCEYEDGVLIERNLGTQEHSWLQLALGAYFFRRRKLWGIHAFTEQRIRLRPRKYMISDLCIILGERPKEAIFTTPPLLWIEILSPEDRPLRVSRKVREILDFGVPYVWVIDPETLESDLHTASASRALEDGLLRSKFRCGRWTRSERSYQSQPFAIVY